MNDFKNAGRVYLATIGLSLAVGLLDDILYLNGINLFEGRYALNLFVSALILASAMLVYVFVIKKEPGLFRFKKIGFGTVLLCVLFYVCMQPVMTIVNLLSQLYSKNVIANDMLSISEEVPLWLALLIVAVLAPLLEEMVYRGAYLSIYRKRSPLVGVVMSGLLFAVMHGNLNQFTYAFVVGMAFALMVEATDSLFASYIVHALVNGVMMIFLYALPKLFEYLNGLFAEAQAAGDTMTMDLIEEYVGLDSLNMESYAAAADNVTRADVLAAISSYIVPAAIGGILSFFLLRAIAKKNGRWEHIKSMFTRGGDSQAILAEPDRQIYTVGNADLIGEVPAPEPVGKKERIWTWELTLAVVLYGGLMILAELVRSGVITL